MAFTILAMVLFGGLALSGHEKKYILIGCIGFFVNLAILAIHLK